MRPFGGRQSVGVLSNTEPPTYGEMMPSIDEMSENRARHYIRAEIIALRPILGELIPAFWQTLTDQWKREGNSPPRSARRSSCRASMPSVKSNIAVMCPGTFQQLCSLSRYVAEAHEISEFPVTIDRRREHYVDEVPRCNSVVLNGAPRDSLEDLHGGITQPYSGSLFPCESYVPE